MKRLSRLLGQVLVGLILAGLTTGCDLDGIGLKWLENAIQSAGDLTPVGGDSGGGGGGDTEDGNPTTKYFAGVWMAAYGDEIASQDTSLGKNEYAVRITLTQNGNSLSGTGAMFRAFREGSVATDEVALTVSGRATSDYSATISLRPTLPGDLDFNPTWYVRLSLDRAAMAGMYAALDLDGDVMRSGYGMWHRVGATSVTQEWAAAFTDAFPASGDDKYDRTAHMILNSAAAKVNGLSGNGSFVLQREDDAPLAQAYQVTQGGMDTTQVGFTFGGADLTDNEMDWFGFHTQGLIVALYTQFNAADILVQNGHATWRQAAAPPVGALQYTWVTAFADSSPTGTQGADYLVIMTLQVAGNEVTGSAQVLDESAADPEFRTFAVDNGTLVGSRAQLDLVGTNTRWTWELRLAGNVLVGSYQRRDVGTDAFLSRGSAEWRRASSLTIVGAWAAGFHDTFASGAVGDRIGDSQLAYVEVSDSSINGQGSLRIAGDDLPQRSFTLSGARAFDNTITWEWTGGDFGGSTVWHVRRAGDYLYGTYTNFVDPDGVEFRGHALFIRTN